MVAAVALAVFAALTVAVTSKPSLGFDSRAFQIGSDLRAPWLDTAARVVTTMGLIAIVGVAVVIGGAFLAGRGHRARGAALIVSAALVWASVWIVKWLVDRPRPPAALVHTAGRSYPSGHAANAVGWLALALAVSIVIPTGRARIAAIVAGALLTVLVGLSRIYLRAHYATDVLAGEALAVAIYAIAGVTIASPERERVCDGD